MPFTFNFFMRRFIPAGMRRWKERQAAKSKNINGQAMGWIERQFVRLEPYDPSRALVLDYIELYVRTPPR